MLLDRYIDSSIVYQGHVGGLGRSLVSDYHKLAPLNIIPFTTFLLDIPVDVTIQRIQKAIASL